jgi:hypothetical protein
MSLNEDSDSYFQERNFRILKNAKAHLNSFLEELEPISTKNKSFQEGIEHASQNELYHVIVDRGRANIIPQ